MKVLKKQYYICVDSRPDLGVESFSVRISPNLKSMLREWGPTTRISPIWQLRPKILDKELVTKKPEARPTSIWFLHGRCADFIRDHFSQEQLASLYHEAMWLSIGTHTIILICHDPELDIDIRNICHDNKVSFERWNLQERDAKGVLWGNSIEYHIHEDYFSSKTLPNLDLATCALSQTAMAPDNALGFMQFELYALLAVTEGRSHGAFSVLSEDAIKVEALAHEVVNGDISDIIEDTYNPETSPDEELASRPDILLTLNAGLSRMSSQAFSGSSPILRTECHFWPHSLLGTGVANLALRNVTAFLTLITAKTSYDQRLFVLENEYFDINKFSIKKPDVQFPDFACIEKESARLANNLDNIPKNKIEELNESIGEAITPITYFSGRDGFMNGALTTSAPLPSVAGCNSYQWNLGTITHEISHRILGGHIFEVVESFLDEMFELQEEGKTGVSAINAYFQSAPTSYRHYASKVLGRVLMLYNCLGYDEVDMKGAMDRPFDFFLKADESYTSNLEELLVHIFDFYHFYNTKSEIYCNFVWLSWAVLPSIDEKLQEYVIRTLVALGVKYIDRGDWKVLAIADFQSALEEEPLKTGLNRRIRDGINEIISNEEQKFEIDQFLDMSEPLLILFHIYFKSDELRLAAARDPYGNPQKRVVERKGRKESRDYHYRFPSDTFVSESPSVGRPKFSNPLLFLRDYSREETPNAAESAWLLHMLAFNLDWKRSVEGDSE